MLTGKHITSIIEVVNCMQRRNHICAIFGGAAAQFYGSNRDITDIDMITDAPPELVDEAQKELGGEYICLGKFLYDGVEVHSAPIRMRGGDKIYYWDWPTSDAEAVRVMTIGHETVHVLRPEEIVLMKLVLRRGSERGKFDMFDCKRIICSAGEMFSWDNLYSRADLLGVRARVNESVMLLK